MNRYQKDEHFNIDNFVQTIRKALEYDKFMTQDVLGGDSWESLASIDRLAELGHIELMQKGEFSQHDIWRWK